MERFGDNFFIVKSTYTFEFYRHFLIIALIVQIFALTVLAEPDEVVCERIANYQNLDFPAGWARTCFMKNETTINSNETTLGMKIDDSISGLKLNNNKNITWLPNEVAEVFPNLLIYNARNCLIGNISRKNFEKLNKLKNLNLGYNKIQKIAKDTFKELTELKVLYLCKKNFDLKIASLCCHLSVYHLLHHL